MRARVQAIRAVELRKRYGDILAVDGVSIAVEAGEIFGLLGPNGAGKTTTVEMIEGLRRPDAGTVHVLGHDLRTEVAAVRQRIGVQLQTTALFPRLTVREVLELFRTFYAGATASADELIDLLDLTEKAGSLTRDLSGTIIAEGSPAWLVDEHFKETAIELPAGGDQLHGVPGVERLQREGDGVTLYSSDTGATLSALTAMAAGERIDIDGLHVRRPSLEDVFLRLTGRHIRD